MVLPNTTRRALGAWLIASASTLRGSQKIAPTDSVTPPPSNGAPVERFFQSGTGAKATTVQAKLRSFVHVTDFDLDPARAHLAIQRAMDAAGTRGGGEVLLPEGTLTLGARLAFNHDNVHLVGRGRYATVLVYSPTEGPAIWNPLWTSVTRYGCGLHHFKLLATGLTGPNKTVINFGSQQFGAVEDVWALGSGSGSCVLLMAAGTFGTTECTYNEISACYFGLGEVGIGLYRGANSNTIRDSRFQIGAVRGRGIDIFGEAGSAPNNLRILNNGIEHPGHTSDGIHIRGEGHTIAGNRFEGLKVAIDVKDGSVNATLQGNYYSDCLANFASAGSGIVRVEQGGIIFDNGTKLDHYEDGTFTPVLEGVTRAGKGDYTLQIGRFSRIGRTVTFQISLAWKAHTGAGTMRIAGLPFIAFNAAGHAVPVQVLPSELSFPGGIAAAAIPGTKIIQIYAVTTDTVTGGITIARSGTVHLSGTYTV